MPETCGKCGEQKPIALALRKRDGTNRLLCKECGDEWLDSDEEWPPKKHC